MAAPRTALIAGATGLVGGHCLELLLSSPAYGRVVALVRKPLSLQNPKLECRVVDFDRFQVTAGELAAGVRYFLVSSVDANTKSGNFYLRTKGELEKALAGLPFAAMQAFRPSFLLGERAESRPAERAGIAIFSALNPLIAGPFRKYRAISAQDVARAMLAAAAGESGARGFHIHEGAGLQT